VSRDLEITENVDRVSKTRGSSPSFIKWTAFATCIVVARSGVDSACCAARCRT
jgi:hypothetical protein